MTGTSTGTSPRTESQFDQFADLYEQSVRAMPWRTAVEQYSVLTALGELRGRRVLDLGCGSGIYTRLLARHGARSVLGVDQSAGMIAYARRREEEEPLGVVYAQQDAGQGAEHGSVPDAGMFDLVVAVYLLPYASSPDALRGMCATARAALRGPGGRFVTATLNPGFATTAHYYRPYGFDLTTPRGPQPRDGDPIGLHAEIGSVTLDVTARYWSRQTHERALRDAGFSQVIWTAPQCSPDADPTDFASYLDIPHALLLTATW